MLLYIAFFPCTVLRWQTTTIDVLWNNKSSYKEKKRHCMPPRSLLVSGFALFRLNCCLLHLGLTVPYNAYHTEPARTVQSRADGQTVRAFSKFRRTVEKKFPASPQTPGDEKVPGGVLSTTTVIMIRSLQ